MIPNIIPKYFSTMLVVLIGLLTSSVSHAAFIYHDIATTTGGEFSGSFTIENLKDAGHTSHTDLEDASDSAVSYATANSPTGGFPVTITLDFTQTVDLTDFYLWNHTNSNGTGAPANGVGDFTLTFYDGASGGGSVIGSAYSSTAVAALAAGTYAAQTFDFGTTYAGVRSVEFLIANKANDTTDGFVAMREIGFEAVPEPSSLALISLTLGAFLLKRRR